MDETEINGFGIGMGSGSGKPPVDVFLLSLPGTRRPHVGDVHDMFRQLIQSVGCQVHDILDPEMVRFEFCFVLFRFCFLFYFVLFLKIMRFTEKLPMAFRG
jgi:hypothetical protein